MGRVLGVSFTRDAGKMQNAPSVPWDQPDRGLTPTGQGLCFPVPDALIYRCQELPSCLAPPQGRARHGSTVATRFFSAPIVPSLVPRPSQVWLRTGQQRLLPHSRASPGRLRWGGRPDFPWLTPTPSVARIPPRPATPNLRRGAPYPELGAQLPGATQAVHVAQVHGRTGISVQLCWGSSAGSRLLL